MAVVRARSPLARRAARDRAAAAVLALAVAVAVGTVVSRAEAERARWGRSVPVAVARRALEAGTELGVDDVELRSWPMTLVPDGALSSPPLGRRVASGLVRGEPIVRSRLAPTGAGSTAAMVGEGRAAVSVPLGPAAPRVEPGDRVDVLAPAGVTEPWAGTPDGGGAEVVAAHAQVVALDDDHATIVVAREELERTAAAILDGAITIAVTR